jgi:hypothetical protein
MNTYNHLQKKELAAKVKPQVDEVTKIYTTLATLRTKANSAPWDGDSRYEIGAICMKIGRIEEARTWLQAALACNPTNSRARRLLNQLPAKEKVASASESSGGPK